MSGQAAHATASPHGVGQTRGITAEFLRLVGSSGRHVQALLALAATEGQETVALYVRLAIAAIVAIFFAASGYLFALLSIAFLVAWVFGVDWMWICLAIAILHLALAAAFALHVKNHFRSNLFPETSEAIRKDLAALRPPGS